MGLLREIRGCYRLTKRSDRRYFIGGSDARIIMGEAEEALLRLWREKRGEVEPEDLSGNLIAQLGLVTEELNQRWYEVNTGGIITDVQRLVRHPTVRWMGATLDGRIEENGAVFEAKFMLPWSFSEEAAVKKYMAQLQPNMWVVPARGAVLSVITGGGKWEKSRPMPIRFISTSSLPPRGNSGAASRVASRLRCSDSNRRSRGSRRVRIVDMSSSNAWAEFSAIFARTRPAYLAHEKAKTELKSLVPEDAQQAVGHGVRARRSKNRVITFELHVNLQPRLAFNVDLEGPLGERLGLCLECRSYIRRHTTETTPIPILRRDSAAG
jgi:hypothetical protein